MTTPKHHPVTAATIARWIQTGLSKASIDTSIFKAYSICSASTSAAADAGLSVSEIMEAADWSLASVIEKFYYRPHRSSSFGFSVILLLQTCIVEPNFLKYNCWMAKHA